jgi:ATP-binding cassette, subfamily C, bacteriocin exporter
MFNVTEQLVTVKSLKDFGIKAVLLFLLFLAFIAIVLLKNSIATRGIKSFINEFNNHLAKSIFVSSTDRGKQSAGIINSLLNAVQQFGNAVVKLVSDATFYGILFITAFVYVSIHLVLAGVFIFVSSGALIVFIWLSRKKISQLSVMGYQAEIQKADNLANNFEFYKYILLSNSEIIFSSATSNVLNFSVDTREKLRLEKNRFIVWYVIVSALMLLIVISMFSLTKGYYNQLHGLQVIGWLIVYLLALNGFVNMLMDYFQLKVSFGFLYDFLGKELPKSENNLNEFSKPLVQPITNFSANKLSFSYPGKLPVFQNISFTAEKGKVMAIYGGAGSGKSTLASLLNRLLPLEEGDITIDGTNWQTFNNFQWRKCSSTVLQPVQLFNSSILENIGWVDRFMDQEKITTFCKQTGFDKFFTKLPDGYATNPYNLSVGQKQMVALAAAIYRKPEILLLDEPLAYMDDEMKEFCWQLLQEIKKEYIVIMFSSQAKTKTIADTLFEL